MNFWVFKGNPQTSTSRSHIKSLCINNLSHIPIDAKQNESYLHYSNNKKDLKTILKIQISNQLGLFQKQDNDQIQSVTSRNEKSLSSYYNPIKKDLKISLSPPKKPFFSRFTKFVDKFKNQQKSIHDWTNIRLEYEKDLQKTQKQNYFYKKTSLSPIITQKQQFSTRNLTKSSSSTPYFANFKRASFKEKKKFKDFYKEGIDKIMNFKNIRENDNYEKLMKQIGIENIQYHPSYIKDENVIMQQIYDELKVTQGLFNIYKKAEEQKTHAKNREKLEESLKNKQNQQITIDFSKEYRRKSNIKGLETKCIQKNIPQTERNSNKSIEIAKQDIFRHQKYLRDIKKAKLQNIKKRILTKFELIYKLGFSVKEVYENQIFPYKPYQGQLSKEFFQLIKLNNVKTIQKILYRNEYILFEYNNVTISIIKIDQRNIKLLCILQPKEVLVNLSNCL